MQTFLPYADFKKSAQTLDRMRLGKQRVETLQVLQVLLGLRLHSSWKDEAGKKHALPQEEWRVEAFTPKGWSNHPAARMWRGHERALLEYQRAICEEWLARGYSDSCLPKSEFLVASYEGQLSAAPPVWLGNEDFHEAHRSNLLRKESEHYSKLWGQTDPTLPYVWPAS